MCKDFHLFESDGDEESPVYRFQYGLWVTESSSLCGSEDGSGYRQAIWEKGGQYACPSRSSYDIPFARECGWEFVVDFPSHQTVVNGPDFTGDSQWYREFHEWWEKLPKNPDPDEEDLSLAINTALDKLLNGGTHES